MNLAHWVRVSGPFLAGCVAGLCLALGVLLAVRSGVAAFDGDWSYVVALVWAAVCLLVGGWLVIFNGMELHRA